VLCLFAQESVSSVMSLFRFLRASVEGY